MKKFTSLLMGCSLALAGAALAQQPEEQQTPKNKQGAGKTHAAEAKPGANAAKPEATAAKQRGAMKERGATERAGRRKGPEGPAGTCNRHRHGNGCFRSTGRQCDARREASGGAAQERQERACGKREDNAEYYYGNGDIGKCSSIGFGSRPAKRAS
jgi:hypothetical protein